MPSIDPLKDVQADDLRIAQGATTGERVALEYNRSDFWENVKKRAKELIALPKPVAPQPMQNQTPAKPDTQDQEKEEGEE